jgi:hypothetical protein
LWRGLPVCISRQRMFRRKDMSDNKTTVQKYMDAFSRLDHAAVLDPK